MSNAIIRYINNSNINIIHLKYIGFTTIDNKSNTDKLGHNITDTIKRRLLFNNELLKFYTQYNVYKYLDHTWKSAPSRRFLLGGANGLVTGLKTNEQLDISRLCKLYLSSHNIYNGVYNIYNGPISKKHNNTFFKVPKNISNEGPIYYIALHDLIQHRNKLLDTWHTMNASVTIYCIPVWFLGVWIEIKNNGQETVSRHIYNRQLDKALETCGLVLAGYTNSVKQQRTGGSEFWEFWEMIAFNYCYIAANDLGLQVRARYKNQFGGPQEFIFTNNRFIAPLYPPLHKSFPSDNQYNNTNDLMMTNVGLYSISRPRDSARITTMIVDMCRRLLRVSGVDKLIITDATAGVGGDTIAFARGGFAGVNSCEIVPEHCRVVANNVAVFGLNDKVRVVCGDYMSSYTKLEQDVIYIDAPWGGSGYENNEESTGLKLFGKVEFATVVKRILGAGNTKLLVLKVPADFNSASLAINTKQYHAIEHNIGRIRIIAIKLPDK